MTGRIEVVQGIVMSTTQIRRQRARATRIRAYVRTPGKWYQVWSNGTKYIVWHDSRKDKWECTCRSRVKCKHIQRVEDREEKRIRKEALEYEQQHTYHERSPNTS